MLFFFLRGRKKKKIISKGLGEVFVIFLFFSFVCVSKCVCKYVCLRMETKVHRCLSCFFSTVFFEAGSVTGSKLILARLASKAPNTRIQMCMPPCLTFRWVLGIQTQIPILAWSCLNWSYTIIRGNRRLHTSQSLGHTPNM